VFAAAWLDIGDHLRVTATEPGRLTVERVANRSGSRETNDAAHDERRR